MAKPVFIVVFAALLSQVLGQVNPDESQYGYSFYSCLQYAGSPILDYQSPLSTSTLTNTACAQYAVSQGQSLYYAVNTNFGCWYGTHLGLYSVTKSPSTCNTACPGNSSEICGGGGPYFTLYKVTGRITNSTAQSQVAAYQSSSRSAFYASKSSSLSAWGSSRTAASTSRSIARSSLSASKLSVSMSRSLSYSSLYAAELAASTSHSIARSIASANKLSSRVSRQSYDSAHYASLVAAGQAKTASEQSARNVVLSAYSSSLAAASLSRAAANSILSASRASARSSRASADVNKASSRSAFYSAKSSNSAAASASKSAYLSSLSAFRASVSASKYSHSSSLSAYDASLSSSYSQASSSKSVAQANRVNQANQATPPPTSASTSTVSTTTTSYNPYATYPTAVANYAPAIFDPTWNVCPNNDTLVIADDHFQTYEFHLFCDSNIQGTTIAYPSGYSQSSITTFLQCMDACCKVNYNDLHVYCEAIYYGSDGTCNLLTDLVKQTNNPAGRGHQYNYYQAGATAAQCLNQPMYPAPTQTKATPNDS